MATHRNEQERLHDRKLVLYTAARMFLEKGYEAASVRQIASAAGINVNTMVHDFGAKENILCELVEYVLKGQFSAAKNLLLGMTEDGVLYYAAETALQLHMAECSEAARNLYRSAYSLSLTSELIQRNIAEKLTSVSTLYSFAQRSLSESFASKSSFIFFSICRSDRFSS